MRDKTTFSCRMQQTFGSEAIKREFKDTLLLTSARPGKLLLDAGAAGGTLNGAGGAGAPGAGGVEGEGRGGEGAGAAAMTLAAAACPARRRPVRENLHDFLAKKRQIFLVQVGWIFGCVLSKGRQGKRARKGTDAKKRLV